MSKIMLHICCAPCATVPVEELKKTGEVVGVFVNPNIHPEEEYLKRLENARRFAEISDIRLIEIEYAPDEWERAVAGLENEPEGGLRCETCYKVRLEKAAEIAVAEGCDSMTTTLSISPHKKAEVINRIGVEAARAKAIEFIEDDFKKDGGYRRSVERSKELGLYRQNYCGCRFAAAKRRDRFRA